MAVECRIDIFSSSPYRKLLRENSCPVSVLVSGERGATETLGMAYRNT